MAQPESKSRFRSWNHRRIDFLRRVKLKLVYLLCSPFNSWAIKPNPSYLVLRLDDKLGDSVTSTGFLRLLKTKNPNSTLTVIAGPSTVSVYRELGFVDSVVESRKGFFSSMGLYIKLRGREFGYIINTSHILNPRTVFFVTCLKAFRKVSFGNSGYDIFSDIIQIDFKKEHVTDRFRSVLKLLEINYADDGLNYVVKVPEKAASEVAPVLESLRAKCRYLVALNSFAGGRLRNFNQQTTVELVRELTAQGDTVVISIANAGDHRLISKWNTGEIPSWVYYPKFSDLAHNLALVSGCDVVITPDTAWVHLASALKKKIVAVYRPDRNKDELNSVIWAPYGSQSRVVFADIPEQAEDDINYISVKKTVEAASNLLGR